MKPKLFICVCGSRDIVNYRGLFVLLEKVVAPFRANYNVTIIEGGARGIDRMARHYADTKSGVAVITELADWTLHGKSAGFIRNDIMVKKADIVVAVWDGESNGTLNSMNRSVKANKPLILHLPNSGDAVIRIGSKQYDEKKSGREIHSGVSREIRAELRECGALCRALQEDVRQNIR